MNGEGRRTTSSLLVEKYVKEEGKGRRRRRLWARSRGERWLKQEGWLCHVNFFGSSALALLYLEATQNGK